MIPAVGVSDVLFDVIYGAAALIFAAILIVLRVVAKKNGPADHHDSFFWIYNKRRGDSLAVLLSFVNAAAVALYVLLTVITRGRINTDSCLIAVIVLGIQLFDIIKTGRALAAKSGKAKRTSRKNGMLDYELTELYKSANAFLTVGILPFFTCIFYGDFWYKIIGPLALFVITHVIGYFYAVFRKRKIKGEMGRSDGREG